jgi:hypothetical protein
MTDMPKGGIDFPSFLQLILNQEVSLKWLTLLCLRNFSKVPLILHSLSGALQ